MSNDRAIPPDSPILKLREQNQHNFDRINQGLGPIVRLPDDLSRLYEHYQALLNRSVVGKSVSIRAAATLYVLCHKHLALATSSLFELHAGQTFRETRAAVEAAAMAYAITTDELKFEIFAKNDRSQTV